MKKIIYGICGIGNGHFYRQLPIIQHLITQKIKILFFAYGESLILLNQYFNKNEYIKIIEVQVPYFIGDKYGVDFIKSEKINDNFDYSINFHAFSEAQKWLGKPDLVISDYEPISAQYGYAYSTQVLTIDQQSKFFTRNTPAKIKEFTCEDEIMRLNMFFPLAKRIAFSFFKVKENHDVKIMPPIYRQVINDIVRTPIKKQYLIYISAQQGFNQPIKEIIEILTLRDEEFHIFIKKENEYILNNYTSLPSNISIYKHGDSNFEKLLATCTGVISTAGHNLLGECMYLNIPVYAIPMNLYEQQLNAKIIGDNFFGLNEHTINIDSLEKFISNNNFYINNIIKSDVLFKKNDDNNVINYILSFLNNL